MNTLLMLGALFAAFVILKFVLIPTLLLALLIACIIWPSLRLVVFTAFVGLFAYALYVNWTALAYYSN